MLDMGATGAGDVLALLPVGKDSDADGLADSPTKDLVACYGKTNRATRLVLPKAEMLMGLPDRTGKGILARIYVKEGKQFKTTLLTSPRG